jgi:4-amino-4-deoxy-L-arabinose transferase-like glycosyltransferase
LLRWPGTYVSGLVAVVVCAGYYWLREHIDPGYFTAVQANDFGGRYTTVVEHHVGGGLGVFYYAAQVKQFPWLLPSLLIGAYQLWRGSRQLRQMTLLLLVASLFYLVVISLGSTKLAWYAAPLAPLSALLLALAATDLLERADLRSKWITVALRRTHVALCAAAAIVVVMFNASKVGAAINARAADELDAYSYVLREARFADAAVQKVAVIHPGYPNNQGDAFYIAPTLFYANALKMAGHSVVVLSPSTPVPKEINTLIACGAVRDGIARLKSINSAVQRAQLCTLYQLGNNQGSWANQRMPASNSSSVD